MKNILSNKSINEYLVDIVENVNGKSKITRFNKNWSVNQSCEPSKYIIFIRFTLIYIPDNHRIIYFILSFDKKLSYLDGFNKQW